MASPTWCTWVWASSGSWWWIGKPGVLQSMGSQRVGHNWTTKLNWALAVFFPPNISSSACSVVWLCPAIFFDAVDYCPPGSSVDGILLARILEWVAISSSRGSFWLRDWTHVSCVFCIGRWIFYNCTTWEVWLWQLPDHKLSKTTVYCLSDQGNDLNSNQSSNNLH